MKMLIVTNKLITGGAEKMLVNYLNSIDPQRYEIDLLLTGHGGELEEDVPTFVNVELVPKEYRFLIEKKETKNIIKHGMKLLVCYCLYLLKNILDKPCSFYEKKQRLWEFVGRPCVPTNSNEYDIAVAFMYIMPSYYVIDKVKAKRKVLWVHNDLSSFAFDTKFEEGYLKQADAIPTISDVCKKSLVSIFPDLEDRIYILPNINNPETLEMKAGLQQPEEFKGEKRPILLSIGRLTNQKGFDLAIDAAAILKSQNVKFVWYVLGEGELREQLLGQIEEKDVEEYFIMLGTRSNPYPYIRYCDIILQTSRYEGKSVVLDEAKALLKPIVATAYNSVSDQIIDGENGIVVPMTAEGIAQGIKQLLEYPENQKMLIDNLGNSARGNLEILNDYYAVFEGSVNDTW